MCQKPHRAAKSVIVDDSGSALFSSRLLFGVKTLEAGCITRNRKIHLSVLIWKIGLAFAVAVVRALGQGLCFQHTSRDQAF